MERFSLKFNFKTVQRLAAIAIVLLLTLMVWSLSDSEIFLVSSIELEIHNGQGFRLPQEEDEVAKELRSLLGRKIWQISLADLSSALMERSWLQEFRLTRVWPDRIRVDLQVKPSQFVFQPNRDEGPLGKQPLLIFSDGSFYPSSGVQGDLELPILRSSAGVPTQQLFVKANKFLSELPHRGPFSVDMISEFFFSDRRGWVVRLLGTDHEIRIGSTEIAVRAERVNRVLTYLQSQTRSMSPSSASVASSNAASSTAVNRSENSHSLWYERSQMFARVIDASLSKKVLVRPRNQP